MKPSIASALFAAAIIVAAPSFANAAAAARPETKAQAGHFQFRGKDLVVRTTRRLGDLGKKLDIKPSQQAAWQTYSAAIIAQARVQKHQWQQMRVARRASREHLTTPERMAKIADRLRQASERMSQLASETKTFYDQLGPEQKTIFDLYARTEWRGARRARGRRR